jgi:acyl-CoA dehydrogenase
VDRPAPIINGGAPEMLDRVARPVLAGEKKIAFAVTEPGGGSDVSGFTTTAERRGDVFVVNGGKTLISGAMKADFLLTAVRTGGPGMGGLSMLLIETDRAGVSAARSPVCNGTTATTAGFSSTMSRSPSPT